eukprot:Gb_24302 [translate_table: standard]
MFMVGIEEEIKRLKEEKSSWLQKESSTEEEIKRLKAEKHSWLQKEACIEEEIQRLKAEKESWHQKEIAAFKNLIIWWVEHSAYEQYLWLAQRKKLKDGQTKISIFGKRVATYDADSSDHRSSDYKVQADAVTICFTGLPICCSQVHSQRYQRKLSNLEQILFEQRAKCKQYSRLWSIAYEDEEDEGEEEYVVVHSPQDDISPDVSKWP